MGLSLLDLPLPVKIVPAAPLSDEELISFARANEPYRIEQNAEGEIIVMTPAGGETSSWEAYLTYALTRWAIETGNGISFSPSAGFRLPDKNLLSPDASWMATDRWNSLSRQQQRGFSPLCPDFLIELRSPSGSACEVETKMAQWMSNGAQLAWLIGPIRKVAIVYCQGREPEMHQEPEFLEGEGPLSGFRLDARRFWA
jgi:Uma2 family endonuclease